MGFYPCTNTSMENRSFRKFIELAHDPGIPYISKGNGNQLSKWYMHSPVYRSIFHNSQDMSPMDEWRKKMWEIDEVIQKVSSHVLWKIETFIEQDKIQETLYIGQWHLSPLQSRHLGTSHSSPNHHQLPCHIFLNLTDSLKSPPFQRWF